MNSQSNQTDKEVSRAFIDQAREYLKGDYLPKLRHCLNRLTDEQVWWRPNEESNSIGNLLLHLSGNARQWIATGLGGGIDGRVRQTEFDQRAIVSRKDLLQTLEQTLTGVEDVLVRFDDRRLLETFAIQGTDVTALEAIFHVTEHFSMHTGQIILLTKLLTASDLHFYDFEGDAPLQRWASHSSDSS